MSKIKIVYLASPYSAKTMYGVECNIHEVRGAALELAKKKIVFFCPVLHTAHFETYLGKDDPGYEYWLASTIEMLKRCDAMLLSGSWMSSTGVLRETDVAKELRIPIFMSMHKLEEWYFKNEN